MSAPSIEEAFIKMLAEQMASNTKAAMVLLDGMLHQAHGLGIPSNIVFVVIDSYIMQMRRRLEGMYGKEIVAELEKGAEDGSKTWWRHEPDKKPGENPAKPEPAPPAKAKDEGPNYIA